MRGAQIGALDCIANNRARAFSQWRISLVTALAVTVLTMVTIVMLCTPGFDRGASRGYFPPFTDPRIGLQWSAMTAGTFAMKLEEAGEPPWWPANGQREGVRMTLYFGDGYSVLSAEKNGAGASVAVHKAVHSGAEQPALTTRGQINEAQWIALAAAIKDSGIDDAWPTAGEGMFRSSWILEAAHGGSYSIWRGRTYQRPEIRAIATALVSAAGQAKLEVDWKVWLLQRKQTTR